MIKVRILGGSREVGRMGLVIKSRKTNVLLDYGFYKWWKTESSLSYPPKNVAIIDFRWFWQVSLLI